MLEQAPPLPGCKWIKGAGCRGGVEQRQVVGRELYLVAWVFLGLKELPPWP